MEERSGNPASQLGGVSAWQISLPPNVKKENQIIKHPHAKQNGEDQCTVFNVHCRDVQCVQYRQYTVNRFCDSELTQTRISGSGCSAAISK